MILATTHVGAFLAGQLIPWHYSDFASTCRTGADAAREIRKKLDHVLGLLHPVLREAERVSDRSTELFKRLTPAYLYCAPLSPVDTTPLRAEKLELELDAFFAAVAGRTNWGVTGFIASLNEAGAITDPDSLGRKNLEILKEGFAADIRACQHLIGELGSISNWPGFARHRVRQLLDRRRYEL